MHGYKTILVLQCNILIDIHRITEFTKHNVSTLIQLFRGKHIKRLNGSLSRKKMRVFEPKSLSVFQTLLLSLFRDF